MPRPLDNPAVSRQRSYDGIICFGGEDWWYHNRGHYDMRMMRELSAHMPVLYVNSLGMRVPRITEGSMFLRRIARKLSSIKRGFVKIEDNFGVLSPISLPGERGASLSKHWLARRINKAAKSMNINNPLVWVACPIAVGLVDSLNPAGLVYQRTDRYECFPGVKPSRVRACDDRLKASADLTVFCGDLLYEREAIRCRNACQIDHGVDYERFASAGENTENQPADMASLPRPRVGFVGGIDSHTFDAALFRSLAEQLDDVQFVLVGACSLPDGWCELPNVTMLGQRPYEQVADYMAACDVLIMPWRTNQWIESCNPVKLKEYLAIGRPIVSTDFHQVRRYSGAIRISSAPQTFIKEVRNALKDSSDAADRRLRIAGQNWSVAAETAIQELEAIGLSAVQKPVVTKIQPVHTQKLISEMPRLKLVGRDYVDQRGLRACIVLAGGLRPSPLVEAAGRSVLDLYLTPDKTVLDVMAERLSLLNSVDGGLLPIRVAHNAHVPAPWPSMGAANVRFEQDPQPYRGPAGLIADLCASYNDEDHVLILEASRVLAFDIEAMVTHHFASGSDITVACEPDESPSGVYLANCAALRHVVPVGFVDLKEQWLAQASQSGMNIGVHRLDSPGAIPLRTRADFLVAARYVNEQLRSEQALQDSLMTIDIKSDLLRVIGRGAALGPGVSIRNAVIMPGAVVGGGAVIERSVVCPGAVIEPKAYVVEAVVSTSGSHVDSMSSSLTSSGHFGKLNYFANVA